MNTVTHVSPAHSLNTINSPVRWPLSLPVAAHDPRVTIHTDLDEALLGQCAKGWDEHPADWRITYQLTERGTVWPLDVCEACADEQLRELVDCGAYCKPHLHITLHLPRQWAPLPANVADLAPLMPLHCDQATPDRRPCTTVARYLVAWTDRAGGASRELACKECLAGLVDHAETVGDGWTGPSVNRLPDTDRSAAA